MIEKEITCPYTWDCGQKFEICKLSEYDYDFLQSAIDKEMSFMFIHCPECLRRFQFNPVEWKAKASLSDPSKKNIQKPKTIKELTSVLKKAKVEIPESYFNYLTSDKFNSELEVFKGQGKFHLYNLDELCEEVNIDGNSYLRIESLKGYAKSLEDIFEEEYTDEFSLSELSVCLTLGFENTQVLFLDGKDKNTIWIFHPDGGDIEPAKITLDEIANKNK
ncbi:hypothetical protein D0T84_20915 [Dysgonomonas sp. 521]|uniref:hypothetical protein n=1 Tax=Dysgonomonas sp. 521 TaxID=2302932 RepID=UPI0013D2567D|nr:hypothetical protein [Dysgonomonas sp. 521]NDV97341.1 hypothetical protein [Dysgonomonas sp. 521]